LFVLSLFQSLSTRLTLLALRHPDVADMLVAFGGGLLRKHF
jgi:hypothetical protein